MELFAQEPLGWSLEEACDMCLCSALDIPKDTIENLFYALAPLSSSSNNLLELPPGAKLALNLPSFHLACQKR